MAHAIDDAALDQIFRTARSYNGWQEKPVSDELLHQIYDLLKFGPTSGNGCPARFVFVTSPEAKERLKPCLGEFNVEKVMAAPAVAIGQTQIVARAVKPAPVVGAVKVVKMPHGELGA